MTFLIFIVGRQMMKAKSLSLFFIFIIVFVLEFALEFEIEFVLLPRNFAL